MPAAYFRRDLPPGLEPLRALALDLRWTWSHGADSLWRTVDPASWQRSENPWSILQDVPRARLDALGADAEFRRELTRLEEAQRRHLAEPTWFAAAHGSDRLRCVAYFCMEYGLAEALPLYAGGLGVLAGDYLKTASDLGIPIVGVGLLYQEGFFRQMIDEGGEQHEIYPYSDPTSLPIEPVVTPGGEWLHVSLALPGRELFVRLWRADVGRVPLYLLDTNDPLNSPVDRGITAKLYPGSADIRLLQQFVLGIGGWRALQKLGLEVDICHLNEGHAAFALLERALAHRQRTGMSFWESLWATRAGNVFTTHTSVDAAFDRFDMETVSRFAPYFRNYLTQLGIGVEELLALGRRNPHDDREPFTPAYLAIRGSIAVNAVSRRHGEVSRELFRGLFPRWPVHEVPVSHVTNGVHVPSWDSPGVDRLWECACGKDRWRGTLETLGARIQCVSDDELWVTRGADRQRLVEVARQRLARQLGFRGADAPAIGRAQHVLDPNALTVGAARRFTAYKRPNLLLRDPERLERLLTSEAHPVQLIVAGKAHPNDLEGKQLIQRWIEFASRPRVRDHVAFLEDYDVTLAQELVRGVDVWLNTPRRPWEACGTSGMKTLANGGVNISSLDGWWDEAYDPEFGWSIDGAEDASAASDDDDAARLYEILERQVVPAFYDRDARGIPLGWLARVRASMATLAPRFSANRMAREYVDAIYAPAAALLERRARDGGRLARELDAWSSRLMREWHSIHIGRVEVQAVASCWSISAHVYLGAVELSDVLAEVYADPRGEAPGVRTPMERMELLAGAANGARFQASVAADREASDFTVRVVPYHPDARVPLEVPLIAWQR